MNIQKLSFLSLVSFVISISAYANDWNKNFKSERAIIENKGQFDFMGLDDMSNVKYVLDGNQERIYFTPKGIVLS